MSYHHIPLQELYDILDSWSQGLTSQKAQDILQHTGPNELPQPPKRTIFQMVGEQMRSTLVWILIVAAILSAVLEQAYVDTIVIMIIVIVNTVIGVMQEYKTERTLEHLRSFLTPQARVIRDGNTQIVSIRDIVPGDILLLDEGEKVVADACVIESQSLHVNQAILTGESVASEKNIWILPENTPLSDRTNMVYQGTTITSGSARALVVATGAQTELGHISGMVGQIIEEPNPFSQKLEDFSRKIAIFITVLCVLLVVILLIAGGHISESLLIAISLAVSAIPEGLPAVVALGLALATKRLVKKNVLVRKLPSSETLGRVTVICTDKTGTLTRSQMTVTDIFTEVDEKNHTNLAHISLLCNKAGHGTDADGAPTIFGDPTEIGLLHFWEEKLGSKEALEASFPLRKEYPFDSERKRMSVVRQDWENWYLLVKWAPERILERIAFEKVWEENIPLTDERRQELRTVFEKFAASWKRVLGFAYRDVSEKDISLDADTVEQNLIFIGFVTLMDPPRPEVAPAIAKCQWAGIRVIMITGDSQLTAQAIGKSIGLVGDSIDATLLSQLSDDELLQKLQTTDIFSRIAPEDKLRIVRLLKSQWHIVAMTGDGVNDALALKQADIGIAMGIRWTDVARDASDMVLLDDNFASIVAWVEEGRRIYTNTKKFIKYLLACNFYEVFLVAAAVVAFRSPDIVPFVAIQILWINLVTDGLPALALSTQETEQDVMNEKPHDEAFLSGIKGLVVLAGVIGTVVVGYVFLHFYQINLVLAQTLAVSTSVVYQMMRAIGAGRNRAFDFRVNIWLIGAVSLSLILHFGLLMSPLASYFSFASFREITPYFGYILGLPLIGYLFGEVIVYFWQKSK